MDSTSPTFDGRKITFDNEANEPRSGKSDHAISDPPSQPNFDSPLNSCKAECSNDSNIVSSQQLRKGQDVWVLVGKVEHAAKIECLFYSQPSETDDEMVPKARVKWAVQGNTEEVLVSDIKPISLGKRRAKQPNYYHGQILKSSNQKTKYKSGPKSSLGKRNRLLKSEVDVLTPGVLDTSSLSENSSPQTTGAETCIHSTKYSNSYKPSQHPLSQSLNNDDEPGEKMEAKIRMPTDSSAKSISSSNLVLTPSAKGEENIEPQIDMKSDDFVDNMPFATNPAVTSKQLFFVGEHVWVQEGKENHSASIKSINHSQGSKSNMIEVKWASTGKCDDNEFRNVTAMFEEDGGSSKRKRSQTNRFVPPVKCELDPKEKECAEMEKSSASASISTPSQNPSPTTAKSESQAKETSALQNYFDASVDDMQTSPNRTNNKNSIAAFSVGQHVWVQMGKGSHSATIKSIDDTHMSGSSLVNVKWDSSGKCEKVKLFTVSAMHGEEGGSGKRKRTRTARYTPPQQSSARGVQHEPGKEKKIATSVERPTALAAVKSRPPNARTQSTVLRTKVSAVSPSESSCNLFITLNAKSIPKHSLSVGQKVWFQVGRKRHSASIKSLYESQDLESNLSKAGISKVRKRNGIVCEAAMSIVEKGYRGVESNMAPRTDHLASPQQSSVTASEFADKIEEGPKSRSSSSTPVSFLAPSPSTMTARRLAQGEDSNTMAKVATNNPSIEFKRIRKECKGDEVQAFRLYVEQRRASGKQSLAKSFDRSPRVKKSRLCAEKPSRCSSMAPLQCSPPSECNLASPPNSDNCDPEDDNIDDIRSEYESLHEYYLQPIVRYDEELPSGITLRQRKAPPSLIRCKTSQFRHQLYNRILHLEQSGNKREVYNILKKLNAYDKSGESSEGPPELMKEIMPTEMDEDVVILETPPKTCLKQEKLLQGEGNVIQINDTLTLFQIGPGDELEQNGSPEPDVVVSKYAEQKESENSKVSCTTSRI